MKFYENLTNMTSFTAFSVHRERGKFVAVSDIIQLLPLSEGGMTNWSHESGNIICRG